MLAEKGSLDDDIQATSTNYPSTSTPQVQHSSSKVIWPSNSAHSQQPSSTAKDDLQSCEKNYCCSAESSDSSMEICSCK